MGGSKITQREIVQVYAEVLKSIWKKAVNMLGPVALETMIESAIFDTADKYYFLESLEVSEEGIRLPEDLSVFEEVETETLKAAFRALFTRLFSNVSTLTGQVVVKHLRPEFEQAEEKLNGS